MTATATQMKTHNGLAGKPPSKLAPLSWWGGCRLILALSVNRSCWANGFLKTGLGTGSHLENTKTTASFVILWTMATLQKCSASHLTGCHYQAHPPTKAR